MKVSVIYGAGNIGRGFIGQLFGESGYEVVFVDIDRPLLDALNARHAYTIELVEDEHTERVRVGPVRAVHAGDAEAVRAAIRSAEVMATAVGARALPHVAPGIAAGIRARRDAGVEAPLNCIVCENLVDAAQIVRGLVAQHLSAQERAYLDAHVGFVDAAIARMVPPLTPEMRARDPAAIRVEPYKQLPVDRSGFVGAPPAIEAMQLYDHFEAITARKLYVHNCGHAVLAYLGYLRGYTFGYQALGDPEIAAHLEAAWAESIAGQVAHYGVSADDLRAHAASLRRRLANRALGDTIFRLGRDPVRKLGPTDRLVAPARLAEAAGVAPRALARAIAAALCFDPPQDEVAMSLQRQLATDRLDAVLSRVSQIEPGDALSCLVREEYAVLRASHAPGREHDPQDGAGGAGP
ncbi:MAG: mannitol-1-phosphate 5-dehydrogenase [Anaerolineae bacterium]|nr:mannitol-1-phosphate 5-dehydrogenase [Anaerolineae bacterium]